IENGKLLGLGLGSNDTLGFNQTASSSFGVGTPILLPIPNPILPICIVLEPSAGSASGASSSQMSFEDINGDGLPDMVFKKNDLTRVGGGSEKPEVWVKLNPAGGANLLKHVDNPLGGSFDIEYGRAGNQVDSTTSPPIDMPMNRWVMSAVTVHFNPQTPD